MRLTNKILSVASVAAALAALSACPNAFAQTAVMNASGSSALFLGLGRAAFNVVSAPSRSPSGVGCVWSQASGSFTMTDNSGFGGGQTEAGQEWVAWSTGSTGTCANPSGANMVVYAYQQTDSVVGDRCLFNGCTMTTTANNSTPTSHLVFAVGSTPAEEMNVPNTVLATLGASGSSPAAITAAGTDIRPEDALFATERATTACNTPMTAGAQYRGLGYTSGSTPIMSHYSGATYHVTSFALPTRTGFNVTPVAASAILVAVNHPGGGTSGFGDPAITNLSSGVLANFLDGTYSQTKSALTAPSANASGAVTALIREPLSGTYNTMEYNVPNTVQNQTSQDVGANQPAAQVNCNGGVPASNPMTIATIGTGVTAGARNRVIGTGESLNVLFGNGFTAPTDGIGYAFWSVPNFAHATSTSKYLTIDGVDPLQDSYTGGAIPLAGTAGVANVTLSHIVDGTYPIWSLQRLVDIGNAPGVAVLAAAAQSFPTFGTSTSEPDFVPVSSTVAGARNLGVVRSHFTQESVAPANGTGTTAEAGGDVGGVVYTIIGDKQFNTDFVVQTGKTERRR